MAKVIITFDTDNAAFQDYPHGDGNFDEEVKQVLKQAEGFLIGDRDSDTLMDTNGNTVGSIWRSTVDRRG